MRFTKMQGVGNHFVVVAEEDTRYASLPELSLTLCARGIGIGADGLLVVGEGEGEYAFTFRMFNPDGTEDMCGNGLRCACLWTWGRHSHHWNIGPPFRVWTKEGLRSCRAIEVRDDIRSAVFEVDMGKPKFAPLDIPCLAQGEAERILDYPLDVEGRGYSINSVNTGSTHTVLFGEGPPEDETFVRDSLLIENHPFFPERTTVLWVWPKKPNHFGVRIWERGAGETWGCGTGACAVAVLAIEKGLAAANLPVEVESRGGKLEITWKERDTILMTGPAEVVFEGEL
jgi:diaminopimelate epimerase